MRDVLTDNLFVNRSWIAGDGKKASNTVTNKINEFGCGLIVVSKKYAKNIL